MFVLSIQLKEKHLSWRALNIHVNVDNWKSQREKIFHTTCHVYNKVCILIIDDDSCTNIANIELVKKLNLHTTKHRIPYKLEWLNDGCCYLFFTQKKRRKPKNTRRNPKRFLKLVVEDQNDKWKIWMIKMSKIDKISNPILTKKSLTGKNIFIWGKEIQI